MNSEAETEIVDLGDGQHAIFLKELKHGTARKVQAVTRQFLRGPDGSSRMRVGDSADKIPTEVIKAVEIDLEAADFTAANDCLLLGQVIEWSFGDISQEVLDNIPEGFVQQLVIKANELYKNLPLAKTGAESLEKDSS